MTIFDIQITDQDDHSAIVSMFHKARPDGGSVWRAASPQTIGRSGYGPWEYDGNSRRASSFTLDNDVSEWDVHYLIAMHIFDVKRFPFQVGDAGSGYHEAWDRRIRHGAITWKCLNVR